MHLLVMFVILEGRGFRALDLHVFGFDILRKLLKSYGGNKCCF